MVCGRVCMSVKQVVRMCSPPPLVFSLLSYPEGFWSQA